MIRKLVAYGEAIYHIDIPSQDRLNSIIESYIDTSKSMGKTIGNYSCCVANIHTDQEPLHKIMSASEYQDSGIKDSPSQLILTDDGTFLLILDSVATDDVVDVKYYSLNTLSSISFDVTFFDILDDVDGIFTEIMSYFASIRFGIGDICKITTPRNVTIPKFSAFKITYLAPYTNLCNVMSASDFLIINTHLYGDAFLYGNLGGNTDDKLPKQSEFISGKNYPGGFGFETNNTCDLNLYVSDDNNCLILDDKLYSYKTCFIFKGIYIETSLPSYVLNCLFENLINCLSIILPSADLRFETSDDIPFYDIVIPKNFNGYASRETSIAGVNFSKVYCDPNISPYSTSDSNKLTFNSNTIIVNTESEKFIISCPTTGAAIFTGQIYSFESKQFDTADADDVDRLIMFSSLIHQSSSYQLNAIEKHTKDQIDEIRALQSESADVLYLEQISEPATSYNLYKMVKNESVELIKRNY